MKKILPKTDNMIKEIISDLAFDKINVSQALTRAKLIANQIKNETFTRWLSKELTGYDYEDELIPDYRKVWSEIELLAEFPFGRTQRFPVVISDDEPELTKDFIYKHRVLGSIAVIEGEIQSIEDSKAYIQIPAAMVQLVGEFYKEKVDSYGGVIRSGRRPIGKNQLKNIVEQTKQKLLDTLQQLDSEFTDIETQYKITEDNQERAENIITTNIYGGNNPMNIGAGQNVTQGDVNLSITQEHKEKLKSLGVQENEILELEQIDKESPKGSKGRAAKIMAWVGKVSASLTAKGIYEKTPELIEYVGSFI